MVVDQVVRGIFSRMVAIFQAGQAAGILRADLDPGLCATLLMGANLFFFQAQGMLRLTPETSISHRKPWMPQMKILRINCWEARLLIALQWDRIKAVKYLPCKLYPILDQTVLVQPWSEKFPDFRCMQA